jgi:hypothetical protein
MAFVIYPQFAVSAARGNDNGCAGSLAWSWKIRSDGRFVNISYDMVASWSDSNLFLAGLAFRAGSAVWPEQDFRWACGCKERSRQKNQNDNA